MRDKLTLSDLMQELIHLDEQLTDAQHTIDIQVETIDSLQAEIERLKANFDDLQEKYAQSESDRLDALAKIERLHQLIERQHPLPESN